jgi:hypothetical protein
VLWSTTKALWWGLELNSVSRGFPTGDAGSAKGFRRAEAEEEKEEREEEKEEEEWQVFVQVMLRLHSL